jgi:hypothetical protein|tara:strand:- start:216 stop:482 length:267 start_codon:yes stop_codon:yes gene_type:complete
MLNKLGYYIFKRIQKDNKSPYNRRNRPREMLTGLYINASDIQRYVNDYFDYGIDYMGDDNISSEDFVESQINKPGEERYWDDPDGKEV